MSGKIPEALRSRGYGPGDSRRFFHRMDSSGRFSPTGVAVMPSMHAFPIAGPDGRLVNSNDFYRKVHEDALKRAAAQVAMKNSDEYNSALDQREEAELRAGVRRLAEAVALQNASRPRQDRIWPTGFSGGEWVFGK